MNFSKNPKGQGETSFVLSLMIFVAVIIFLTVLIVPFFPEFSIISGFDFAIFSGSLIGVAGSCAIATGLVCAGALVVFNILTFVTVQNSALLTILFIPLTVTIAYVVSRLARGGG